MRVLDRQPYSYVLLARDGEWILTFLLGGPVERDVSVRLTPAEVTAIEDGESSATDLVETVRADLSAYDDRRIRPTVWPGENGRRMSIAVPPVSSVLFRCERGVSVQRPDEVRLVDSSQRLVSG